MADVLHSEISGHRHQIHYSISFERAFLRQFLLFYDISETEQCGLINRGPQLAHAAGVLNQKHPACCALQIIRHQLQEAGSTTILWPLHHLDLV